VSRSGTILFYGDSHGRFGPLLGAYAERRPDAVVVLGGMMLDAPPRGGARAGLRNRQPLRRRRLGFAPMPLAKMIAEARRRRLLAAAGPSAPRP
jgi:hypothetical protein